MPVVKQPYRAGRKLAVPPVQIRDSAVYSVRNRFFWLESNLLWAFAIAVPAIVAITALVVPLYRSLFHIEINYNEGWNAYHAQQVLEGRGLYSQPPGATVCNYLPLSFYLIALLSRATGDVLFTGRALAVIGMLGSAMIAGLLARRYTKSSAVGTFTGVAILALVAVYSPERIGMDDPHWLGLAIVLCGWLLFESGMYKQARLPATALVVLVAGLFIKQSLVAIPLAVVASLWFRSRRPFFTAAAVLGGTIIGGLIILYVLDGRYLFAHLLAPRGTQPWKADSLLREYFSYMTLPFVAGLLSLPYIWSKRFYALAFAFVLSYGSAILWSLGEGVDRNVYFEPLIISIIAASVGLSALRFRRFAAAAAALPLLAYVPRLVVADIHEPRAFASRERSFEQIVSWVKTRPAPVLCEPILACFEANQPFRYDAYFMHTQTRIGRLPRDTLASLVDRGELRSIVLSQSDAPYPSLNRLRFTPEAMRAIISRCTIAAENDSALMLDCKPGARVNDTRPSVDSSVP